MEATTSQTLPEKAVSSKILPSREIRPGYIRLIASRSVGGSHAFFTQAGVLDLPCRPASVLGPCFRILDPPFVHGTPVEKINDNARIEYVEGNLPGATLKPDCAGSGTRKASVRQPAMALRRGYRKDVLDFAWDDRKCFDPDKRVGNDRGSSLEVNLFAFGHSKRQVTALDIQRFADRFRKSSTDFQKYALCTHR